LFLFEERGSGVRDFGAKVTDLLLVSLAAKDELVLVDREDLKRTLAEAELNLSGVVQTDQATRVGHLVGAKLLVIGSVISVDKKLFLTAKVIGTETGSLIATSVEGKPEDLEMLVKQLADKVAKVITERSRELVAKGLIPTRADRVATLKEVLKKLPGKKPTVMVTISERHLGAATIDPAAQTELLLLLKETGFEVIDSVEGSKNQADVLILGEGLSSFAARHGNLVTVKARLEVRAVVRESSKVLWADRQNELVVDLTEALAGKSALQEAAGVLAERLLPRLIMK
jgi:TolB-like protein